jgi:16S rRNA (guanine966-N2)-methyltransferase
MDAVSAVKSLGGHEPFDVVFMDPPYLHDLEKEVMEALLDSPCITKDTVIVIEASKDTDFCWIEDSGFECYKWKTYKTNEHLFLRKKEVQK